jgi:hypothetical protein
MTYTSHGHHITGSPEDKGDIPPKARCGGPGLCGLCSTEQSSWQQAADREAVIHTLDEARQHEGIRIPYIFQTKVVRVEALQFTGGPAVGMDLEQWINSNGGNATWQNAAEPWTSPDGNEGHTGWPESLRVETPEGWVEASVGSWIIRGTEGEFYPCRDSIFRTKYEEYFKNG